MGRLSWQIGAFFWSEKDYQKISSNIPAIILPHIFTPSAFAFNWDMVYWSWFAFSFFFFISLCFFKLLKYRTFSHSVVDICIESAPGLCDYQTVLWMNVLTEAPLRTLLVFFLIESTPSLVLLRKSLLWLLLCTFLAFLSVESTAGLEHLNPRCNHWELLML